MKYPRLPPDQRKTVKATKEIRAEMVVLREAGWSYNQIGAQFGLSVTCARYHTNPDCKEKMLIATKRNMKKYLEDPVFREKFNKQMVKSQMRRRKEYPPQQEYHRYIDKKTKRKITN